MSYATLEEADEYFADTLFADEWKKAGEKDKQSALEQATLHIDSLMFIGKKLSPFQTNQFPRSYKEHTSFAIEEKIKQANCEEALAILKYYNQERRKLKEQGVKVASRGDLSETYDHIPMENAIYSVLAKRLLKDWIAGAVK